MSVPVRIVLADVLAVLLTDVLLLLQEKDQKYVFASAVRSQVLSPTLPHSYLWQDSLPS